MVDSPSQPQPLHHHSNLGARGLGHVTLLMQPDMSTVLNFRSINHSGWGEVLIKLFFHAGWPADLCPLLQTPFPLPGDWPSERPGHI